MDTDNAPVKKLVMLVDDSEEDTFLFKHAASKARDDIEISTHLDSAALLEMLKQINNSTEYKAPDLIFIDINMPSLDGFEFLQALKSDENLSGVPALMLSTSAYRKDIDNCYQHGAAGYLVKPSSNRDLVEKLNHVFDYWIDTVEPSQIH